VPAGWGALTQVVWLPAPRNWARRHLRRTLEHALEPERAAAARSGRGGGWGGVVLGAVFLAAVMVLPRAWAVYLAHGWLAVAMLGGPAAIGLMAAYVVWLRLCERPLYDLELVKQKLSWPACR